MKYPKISLIIATYKNVSALRLIFSSLEKQSSNDFEVIIAEDDKSSDIAMLVEFQKSKNYFLLKHVYQEDLGWRKNKILNSAIRISSGQFCTFIDGDCIPHKHFIKDICELAKERVVIGGRSVMLSKFITQKLIFKQRFTGTISCIKLFFTCKHFEEGIYLPYKKLIDKNYGVKGRNMTISQNDLLLVNGFDESYIEPCLGEDDDIAWRLLMSGCSIKRMKYRGILYHLYHSRDDRKAKNNHLIFNEKQQKSDWQNKLNGLNKIKDENNKHN